MTFNAVQNVDTLYETAYLALLANTFVHLMSLKDSTWKNDIIKLIYQTVMIVYGNNKSFLEFQKGFIEEPWMTCNYSDR